MKNKIYILFLLAISSFSCEQKSKTYAELEKTHWFLGRWENKTPDGIFSEEWKKENDSVLVGESYFINGKDTLFAETVQLEQQGNNLSYTVSVPNQNEEKPVVFKLTTSTSDYLVFENPEHDFPKKITYKLVTKDSLYAEISGNDKSEGFPFKKVN